MREVEKLGFAELIAIGVGGMIGGGIFSVLGMAVSISGHAAPFAFAIGSLIALAAGYSYIKLALTLRDDGSSFSYLCNAFPNYPIVGSIAGWTVIVGYVGTLALYAFTFGAYGAHLLGSADSVNVRMVLSTAVLLIFMVINLRSVRTTGHSEDLIVYVKIIILGLFAIVGFFSMQRDYLTPVFDQGTASVFMAGALIFVAYEGFQLITNAVVESRDPDRNIPRGIYGSIVITSMIYISLAIVAVGNLTPVEISTSEEYALARVATPVMGKAGVILVDIAALLATSSAINGTVFGASRLMAVISARQMMPQLFARYSEKGEPWVGIMVLTGLGLMFTLFGGLKMIAAFSSMTFLLVSIGVSIANFRLRNRTGSSVWIILIGLVLMCTTVALLIGYLWLHSRSTLYWIVFLYLAVIGVERGYRLFCHFQGSRR